MDSKGRWRDAQEYERNWWASQADEIAAGKVGQLDWYRWRAEQLAAKLGELNRADLADGTARVLEIGAGPIGVATFFPGAQRTTVDPLEEFYATNPALTGLRDPAVRYTSGVGESLPADDGALDLVIMENCIDHTRDMQEVVNEIGRVLRPGGVVYVTVNGRSRWGYAVHRVLSRLRIDAGHPHTFTVGRARRLFRRSPIRVLNLHADSFWAAWKQDLLSARRRDKLKGLIGVSEHLITLFGERQG